MHRIVCSPVVVVRAQARAHLEVQIGRDGDVPFIEQSMQIRPQQETVPNFVRAVFVVGPDVRCLERGQRMFRGDGARSFVRIQYAYAECALA